MKTSYWLLLYFAIFPIFSNENPIEEVISSEFSGTIETVISEPPSDLESGADILKSREGEESVLENDLDKVPLLENSNKHCLHANQDEVQAPVLEQETAPSTEYKYDQTDNSSKPVIAYKKEEKKNLIEGKVAYYRFSSEVVRKILHTGAAYFEVSYSRYFWKDKIAAYASVGYIYKNGRSLGGHDPNHLNFLPLRAGIQGVIRVSEKVKFYAVGGPQYGFVWIHNGRDKFVDESNVSSSLGGFLGVGFLFKVNERFLFDLFGNYSYNRMEFHTSKPNVKVYKVQFGGLTGGLGFGYRF